MGNLLAGNIGNFLFGNLDDLLVWTISELKAKSGICCFLDRVKVL